MSKRRYTQRRRADQQDQTRRKIVEATMVLHEELGAARTTISAVAEEAGVQRLTVYRHFPDETELLEACTTRWLELNPMPGPSEWGEEKDPLPRIRAAFRAFHSYYARTQAMWESAYRDRGIVPALDARMKLVDGYLDGIASDLVKPLRLRGRRKQWAFATLRHGIQFTTWRSLADAGIDRPEASSSVLTTWLEAAMASRIRA